MAETSGRGRRALKRCPSRGGSDGRGSEKNRTLFPEGGRSERIADGGSGALFKGAKNAVSRVGSSSDWAFEADEGAAGEFSP